MLSRTAMADIDISPRREKETFHGDAGSVPSLVFKVVRMKMLNQFMKARLFARSLRHSRAAQRRAALMLLASLLCLVVLRQLLTDATSLPIAQAEGAAGGGHVPPPPPQLPSMCRLEEAPSFPPLISLEELPLEVLRAAAAIAM